MLYLIETPNYYKIGYTIDIKDRMKTYKTHNPEVTLLDECKGNEKIEKMLHKYLKDLRVTGEWFIKAQKVLDIWNFYKNVSDEILSSEEVKLSNEESLKKIKHERSENYGTIINQQQMIDQLKLDNYKLNDQVERSLNQVEKTLEESEHVANLLEKAVCCAKELEKYTENLKSKLIDKEDILDKCREAFKDVLDITIDNLSDEDITSIKEKYGITIKRDRKRNEII